MDSASIARIHALPLEDVLKFYSEWWDHGWKAIADLGKVDRFFLLTHILGRKDAIHPWLYARCREVEADPDDHLDLWAREHYKALGVDTPVWTASGWKCHGDLRFGDIVFAPDGRKVRVIANTGPKEGADCYEVGGVIAAGDHRWPAQIKHRKRVVGGRDVFYTTEITTTRDAKSLRLENPTPLDGEDRSLPISPYVLGVWLGDGTRKSSRVTAGVLDADELEALLRSEEIAVSRRIHSNAVSLRLGNGRRGAPSDFIDALRELGIWENKGVPESYLHARPKDRLALLQGLMDTDGSVERRGTATFVNTNENLIDAVAFLARSLGVRAHKRRYDGFWQVGFQAYQGDYCPFRLSRKREKCRSGQRRMAVYRPKRVASRTVNCIQVEGGQYLAGKELIPTCNSTILTFAGVIQEIIRDPNITIGIFSHNKPTAKKLLSQIRQEFEDNETLKRAYPNVLYAHPKKESPRWSLDSGLVVKRSSNPKEATIEANGLVDGMPTGAHYKLRVYDDVVTEDSVTTPEMIEKTTERWQLSQNLGTEGGRVWYIGTRYHFNDTYGTMLRQGSARERIYPATDDGTENGKPVLIAEESLLRKRRDQGPYIFNCQMLLNPVADRAQGFKEDWLLYHSGADGSDMNKYLLVDPANEKKRQSDYTAIFIVGMNEDRKYYVLDMLRDRLNLTERWDALLRLHRKWKPRAVGYEKYGKDSDIQHFEHRMKEENYRFHITPLGGKLKKEDRIRRLVPMFEGGDILFPEILYYTDREGKKRDLVHDFIEQEYKGFPVALHDDMLDCLSRIADAELPKSWPSSADEQPRRRYEQRPSSGHTWMSV